MERVRFSRVVILKGTGKGSLVLRGSSMLVLLTEKNKYLTKRLKSRR